MSAKVWCAAMRQNTQSVTDPPNSPCYNTAFTRDPFDAVQSKETPMGTCPKCKRRIRHNGNHVKLGATWYHKMCPAGAAKPAPKKP